jgi:Uma2 family endonuclease
MTPTTGTKLTAEEFLAFVQRPENADRSWELIRGEVIEMPPPNKMHGIVVGQFARLLGNYCYEKGGLYVTTGDAGVLLERNPDTVRGPDVAVYADGKTFDQIEEGYSETFPILVVEVLSPNDRVSRVIRKINDYLRAGVRVVWLVDCHNREITVHRPGELPLDLDETQELICPDLLPGFALLVKQIFQVPTPRQQP